MKKTLALLTVCIVQLLFSSCIAETATMMRISGSGNQKHFSIIDNQVYITLEKEGLFSNRYSLYSIVPGEEPYLISSFRGYYSLPVVYRGRWLINKLDVTPLKLYINSSTWCTLDLDGSIKPFDTMATSSSEQNDVFDGVTNFTLIRMIRQDNVYQVMFWDEELSEWQETGVQASVFQPTVFPSLVFSADSGASECQVFGAVSCDFFCIPRIYDGSIWAAIMCGDKLFLLDSSSIILYEVTTEKYRTIYSYDRHLHENRIYNIFLQDESIFFSDPSSKQIIRYDLSTEEIVRTKARTNDCSDFVVVGDWVYSVSEDESSRMHLLMSNLLTGEEYLRVLLVK